jgi:hypothetical protein
LLRRSDPSIKTPDTAQKEQTLERQTEIRAHLDPADDVCLVAEVHLSIREHILEIVVHRLAANIDAHHALMAKSLGV